ncbi:MAG: hypothetical protein DRP47_05505, partial [Candidatus Zixiibacteriota bacterium]
MDSFKRYIRKYGLPLSIYLDKHTTYKYSRKLTIEEELAGVSRPMSQFEWTLDELGVEVIHAHSPQAKGRIERLFGALQDRLVKEMRLKEKPRRKPTSFSGSICPCTTRGSGSLRQTRPISMSSPGDTSIWIDLS